MDTQELKKNFDDQIAKTDQQIRELEDNLVKAKEYKLKLEGGVGNPSIARTTDRRKTC